MHRYIWFIMVIMILSALTLDYIIVNNIILEHILLINSYTPYHGVTQWNINDINEFNWFSTRINELIQKYPYIRTIEIYDASFTINNTEIVIKNTTIRYDKGYLILYYFKGFNETLIIGSASNNDINGSIASYNIRSFLLHRINASEPVEMRCDRFILIKGEEYPFYKEYRYVQLLLKLYARKIALDELNARNYTYDQRLYKVLKSLLRRSSLENIALNDKVIIIITNDKNIFSNYLDILSKRFKPRIRLTSDLETLPLASISLITRIDIREYINRIHTIPSVEDMKNTLTSYLSELDNRDFRENYRSFDYWSRFEVVETNSLKIFIVGLSLILIVLYFILQILPRFVPLSIDASLLRLGQTHISIDDIYYGIIIHKYIVLSMVFSILSLILYYTYVFITSGLFPAIFTYTVTVFYIGALIFVSLFIEYSLVHIIDRLKSDTMIDHDRGILRDETGYPLGWILWVTPLITLLIYPSRFLALYIMFGIIVFIIVSIRHIQERLNKFMKRIISNTYERLQGSGKIFLILHGRVFGLILVIVFLTGYLSGIVVHSYNESINIYTDIISYGENCCNGFIAMRVINATSSNDLYNKLGKLEKDFNNIDHITLFSIRNKYYVLIDRSPTRISTREIFFVISNVNYTDSRLPKYILSLTEEINTYNVSILVTHDYFNRINASKTYSIIIINGKHYYIDKLQVVKNHTCMKIFDLINEGAYTLDYLKDLDEYILASEHNLLIKNNHGFVEYIIDNETREVLITVFLPRINDPDYVFSRGYYITSLREYLASILASRISVIYGYQIFLPAMILAFIASVLYIIGLYIIAQMIESRKILTITLLIILVYILGLLSSIILS